MSTLQTGPKPAELKIKTPDDGSVPNVFELVRDINEVFDSGEPGELSFVRGFLRCLGHSAAGTVAEIPEDLDQEIPPVNPWKLMKSLSKAAVSKRHRREMMARIGEDMSIGDGMGLLATVSMYGYGKNAGLSKQESRDQAWEWYGKSAPKDDPKQSQ
jgi:hypothetical protein